MSAKSDLQAVRGMYDLLPPETSRWAKLESVFRAWAADYGYREIRTPVLEPTALFSRAIGDGTDIVEREMYSFEDTKSGDLLTMRPEGTAACVRAALQHQLLYGGPKRLWYLGPMFRHERPQRGRARQFHQFGVEALGFEGPLVDAEQIAMCARLWDRLGIRGVRLELNSLGVSEERALYRAALVEYLSKHLDILDADSIRRLRVNPLRILDSKNPSMKDLLNSAPTISDFLGQASRQHFDRLCRLLDDRGIAFAVNQRLVRGLDYYNHAVYEWVSDALGAQGTICAGGRYDGLVEQFGGPPTPASGFAMGLERLVSLIPQGDEGQSDTPQVFVIFQGLDTDLCAMRVAELLRDKGVRVEVSAGGSSFKSQFRRADGSGAAFAVVVGENEVAESRVVVKHLRTNGDVAGQQESVPISEVAAFILRCINFSK